MARFVSKVIPMTGIRLCRPKPSSRPGSMQTLCSDNRPNEIESLILQNRRTLSSAMTWDVFHHSYAPLPHTHGLKSCKSRRSTTSSELSFHTWSSSLFSADSNKIKSENLIEAWFNEVSPFGTVGVRNVPFDVFIETLNPMQYPQLDKGIVKMYYDSSCNPSNTDNLPSHKLSELGKLCNLKVQVEEKRLDVTGEVPPGVKLPLFCVITVPLKFDVEVSGSNEGCVSISKLESDSVTVHLEHGNCHLDNLKTASVDVQCDDGNISCSKQLLGSISLRCRNRGSIKGDRLQGISIHCETEEGDIDIKTVYAETSSCISQSGSLHIRSCHGDMTAESDSGDLTVNSLDGKLSAQLVNGSADVFIARQDGVSITAQQGDITMRFSEETKCSLDLTAPSLDHDDSLKTHLDSQGKGFLVSKTGTVVKASAPKGKINLKKEDWLSSIKLQLGQN